MTDASMCCGGVQYLGSCDSTCEGRCCLGASTNNYAVWLLTNDLMLKLRIPWIEAHRRAQAIVLLEDLKKKIAPGVQPR